MADIFLSYAREDRDVVEPLVRTLENAGWTVFWDRQLRPGSEYRRVINEELSLASCVLVVWSKESIRSRWVLDEADLAADREVLIPIRINDTPIPIGFGQLETLPASRIADSLVLDPELPALFEGIREVLRFSRSSPQRREMLVGGLSHRVVSVLSMAESQTTAELAWLLGEPRTMVFRVCNRLEKDGRIVGRKIRGQALFFWPVTGEILSRTSYDRIHDDLGTLRKIAQEHSLRDPMLFKELDRALLRMSERSELGSPQRAAITRFQETLRESLCQTTRKGELLDFMGLREFEPYLRSWQLSNR